MMSLRVVGIDPGISGAFALCQDGLIIDIRDMPTIPEIVSGKPRNRPNAALMAEIFEGWRRAGDFSLYVEKVQAAPHDGAVGAFSFGKGAGMIEGVAAGMGIPYTMVIPQTWKKAMGVPADKNAARARACQLSPTMASMFARVKDDGRAEASIIALYGYRDLVGMMS